MPDVGESAKEFLLAQVSGGNPNRKGSEPAASTTVRVVKSVGRE
jgi:hypothetical protein